GSAEAARTTGEGFAAAGRPSPFLAARSSTATATASSSSKPGAGLGSAPTPASAARSPLDQSAVNPFSASFGGGGGGGAGGGPISGSGNRSGGSNPPWLAGNIGGGGGDGGAKRAVGAGAVAQPLLRRGGGGGGYGSGWGGDGSGSWGDARPQSDKFSKYSGVKGRKVDEQGRQIFYKHGVRLVEAAEIQLESQGGAATTAVFILPYLFLALALWLDVWRVDVTSRFYPPASKACGVSGVCSWAITDAPVHNSFLVLKADFELVDGLTLLGNPDEVLGAGDGGGDEDGGPSDGDEAGGGLGGRQRYRRGLTRSVGIGSGEGADGDGVGVGGKGSGRSGVRKGGARGGPFEGGAAAEEEQEQGG
ncbi:unnamed protein product, partial [Scytosiphon promiscuus]